LFNFKKNNSKGCIKVNSSIALIEQNMGGKMSKFRYAKRYGNLDNAKCYISLLTLLYNKMMGCLAKTLPHLLEV